MLHPDLYRPEAIEPDPVTGPRPAALVREIEPYQAVSSLGQIAARAEQVPHKLDWNEATVPPSPKVMAAIADFLNHAHHLNWYPVLNSANLIERLSAFWQIDPARFLVTNGSDAALDTLCTTYLGPKDRVVVAAPTYQHFLVFAKTRGAQIVEHYGPDPFQNDMEGLLATVHRERPQMIYVVSPNNPTGTEYTPAQVAALCEAAPQAVVIVDEAYSEFSGRSSLSLLHTYSNLVVTRTFSKAYALAGLRIGYAVAHPTVVKDMQRVFNPKSVNILAQVGAMAALDDQEWLANYVREVDDSKALWAEWGSRRKLTVQLTPANFVMVHLSRAPWVVQELNRAGVYVRDRSHIEHLSGFVRFSVGTRAQTVDVLERLDRALAYFGG